MTRPRIADPAWAIVEGALPGRRAESVSKIPTKRLLKSFKVKLDDGIVLLLNLSPQSSRLLRSEQWLMQSEAALLEWLTNETSEVQLRGHEERTEKRPRGEGSLRGWTRDYALDASPSFRDGLINYLPILVKHSSNSKTRDSTFNLFRPTPGDVLSSLEESLTQVEQNSICFQKGLLIRHIANITSPNGRFGIPVTVLGQPRVPGATSEAARELELDFDGAGSWRKTFHLLLEGILRDGEDLAVTMSYELVRTTFHKYSHLLDAITTPRLVVCDAAEDDNVLVLRTPKGQEEHVCGRQDWNLAANAKLNNPSTDACVEDPDEKGKATIQITGLRDWSNCIFGDPLFATIFSHTTPEFELGFQQPCESADITKDDDGKSQRIPDIIEDPENAPTRILLYECYHATVSIVRQFYRPDADSSRRELVARRRLVAALAKLEDVGAGKNASKRPGHAGREGPVKRSRGDTPTRADP
ncbi:hypothetical protein GGS21DRAFT_539336 [Xylaria nigripes]|nr:hypothetical protein GGS21DRAFT_539336 [Xylaria nigripes]